MTEIKIRKDQLVKIHNVAPKWNRRIGKIVRWLHDDWYIVEVDGKEIVLDSSRGEFSLTQDEEVEP